MLQEILFYWFVYSSSKYLPNASYVRNTLHHHWQNASFVTYRGPCGGTSSSQNQLLGRLNTMSTENPKANRKVCSSPRYKYSWSLQGFWRTDWKIKSTAMAITYSVSVIMLIRSRPRGWVWIYAYVKNGVCHHPTVPLLAVSGLPTLHIFFGFRGCGHQLFALLHFKKIGRLFSFCVS